MAYKVAVRIKPDTNATSLETRIQGSSAAVIDGPGGSSMADTRAIVKVIQLCAYDDTKVAIAGNPYVQGAEPTERFVFVLDQKVITVALAQFAALSMAQSIAYWQGQLDAAYNEWLPDVQLYLKAGSAAVTNPKVYP